MFDRCEEIIRKIPADHIKHTILIDLPHIKYNDNKYFCPYPNHIGKEPTCIFLYDKKYFWCKVCKRSYTIINHYQIIYNLTVIQAKDKTREMFNISTPIQKQNKLILPKPNRYTNLNNLSKMYFKTKGITEYSLDLVGIRQYQNKQVSSSMSKIIVIPVLDFNKNHITNKYINLVSNEIYFNRDTNTRGLINIHNTNKKNILYITQSELDLLTLLEFFKDINFKNIVSVPTGAINLTWINYNKRLLKDYPKVIICFRDEKQRIVKEFLKNEISTPLSYLTWLENKESNINEVYNKDKVKLKQMIQATREQSILKMRQKKD